MKKKVIVIGGGAAGLMAAAAASECGADVILFEKNNRVGNKLRITGKGRCNLTNDCDIEEFLKNVPTNPRFLYTALNRFSPSDTKAYFEKLGVPLKTERGKRVFPQSDKATDISDALEKKCRINGVEIVFDKVKSIITEMNQVKGVITSANKAVYSDAVIIATGGKSYPRTGSDGDGYRMAMSCKHSITPIEPSLIPIACEGNICAELQGLSLKNVRIRIYDRKSGKNVYEDFGEMMFTHFGVTGPVILSASAHLRNVIPEKYVLKIDLKPALDKKTLNDRILSDFSKFINKNFENALSELLPQKMIPVVVKLSGIPPYKKVNSITRNEREALVDLLKAFTVYPKGLCPIDEAIVTRGGVNVKEINPKTMESKLVSGLFFAGEVIDVDGYTGGFNLQIAFSTAIIAGESAANI